VSNVCERCGRSVPRLHRHHPTGRDGNGRPLHPELILKLCPQCHRSEHRVWAACGLLSAPATGEAVLRRLALFLGSWPHPLPQDMVTQLAEVLDDLAAELFAPSR
jgi:hypothetical protein